MSAGQVGEGGTKSEKQSAPRGKDVDPLAPETLKKEEMGRGGEGEEWDGTEGRHKHRVNDKLHSGST